MWRIPHQILKDQIEEILTDMIARSAFMLVARVFCHQNDIPQST